ncbi:hypothetical protein P5673_022781 [Acropora cervicornis]|uniref:Uncharacterized protein n=1 Tax=Acropora cervicornis TaxID=6130 RepID=A0AAD9Q681_ACRCE|nr:hypothetical protein P5673_022781 [Acropora cervicornis]
MLAVSICLWMIFASYTEPHRAPQSFQLQVFRRYNASFFKAATDVPVYLEENNALLVILIKAVEETEVSIPKECYISAYSHRNLPHPSLGYRLIKE